MAWLQIFGEGLKPNELAVLFPSRTDNNMEMQVGLLVAVLAFSCFVGADNVGLGRRNTLSRRADDASVVEGALVQGWSTVIASPESGTEFPRSTMERLTVSFHCPTARCAMAGSNPICFDARMRFPQLYDLRTHHARILLRMDAVQMVRHTAIIPTFAAATIYAIRDAEVGTAAAESAVTTKGVTPPVALLPPTAPAAFAVPTANVILLAVLYKRHLWLRWEMRVDC
ncbi:hypothetical protein BJ742DRAFT_848435 [Cladochytrium replicatum]|nr:hypothetical protein BJ742DRAFT_848435 [Cladochytrium replicatum]